MSRLLAGNTNNEYMNPYPLEQHQDIPVLPPLPSSVAGADVWPWRMDSLVRRACPVCSLDDPAWVCVRPDKLRVGRCSHCGMIYVPDRPCEDDLAELYADYGRYKGITPGAGGWWPTQRLWWANPKIMILEHTGGLRGQSLCEIGCSYGSFLRLARKRGAKVSGVEIDEAAVAQLARKNIPAAAKLDTRRSFDIICAFEVFEHVTNPAALVSDIAKALHKDGRLLAAMPNGAEIDRIGPTWVGLRRDLEHMNYFSVGTLSHLLADHGLFVEQHWESLQGWLVRRRQGRSALPNPLLYLLGKLFNHPFYIEGGFVLTALARKRT